MFEIVQRSARSDGAAAAHTVVQRPRQANVKVSQAGDVLEREADRIADRALGPTPRESLETGNAELRLATDTSPAAQGSFGLPCDVSDVVKSSGEPLDPATERFMGPRFGVDFSGVRIHSDERAAVSAHALDARAYTVGSHIVFGAGEYAPSAEAGKRLLAHEMAHVVQQRQGGTPAIQRREGTYPNATSSLQQKGETYEFGYTILKPKKLNAKGPFSAAILDAISRSYFDSKGKCVSTGFKQKLCAQPRHGARQAELILTLLESSADFVDMAAKLDAFYADDTNPAFSMFGGFSGSKFVRAGTPFRISSSEKPTTESSDVIVIDETVNPLMKGADPSNTDEQVAVAFVDALVHETVHAFRQISGLTKPGLKGAIAEELETRKKSGTILAGISSASPRKAIKQAADRYVKAIQADTRSMRQVALSLVSGDHITYLESFFVDGAFGEFFKGYANTKPELIPGLTDLDHPSAITAGAVDDHVQKVRELIEKYSEPRDILIDRSPSLRDETRGVEPAPTVKTLPRILTVAESIRLLDLLDRAGSLKDLSKESKDIKKLSPAGLAVFFHVLLMKTSVIKASLKQEHEDGPDETAKDYENFCNDLAKRFLGETKPYDQL